MLIERELYIEKIKASYQLLPVTVLIGCRQVGKTSLLNLIRVNLDHVFLNGQDPDVAIVFESVPNAEAFLRVNLNERFAGFVIIDEFQYLNNISTFIKILTDKHPDLKFICSGSSSLDILQNVNESLAGRVRIIEIFSLSWPEYILFNDKELYQKFLKCDKDENLLLIDSRFAPIFSEYLLFGGFPRLAAIRGHEEKINLLNDIYVTYLLKDVRAYIRNQDSIGFNKMLRMLSLQIGNMINVNELSNKSGLPYKKAEEYLWLLEQMYIIKLVEPYTTNKRKSLSKMKKMYFTDTGLRNIIAGNFNDMAFRNDSGSIFENYVFNQLKITLSNTSVINYFRTTDGFEVDFIINDLKQQYAVEVKYKDIKKPSKKRYLKLFMAEEGIKELFIVNKTLHGSENNMHYIRPFQLSRYF